MSSIPAEILSELQATRAEVLALKEQVSSLTSALSSKSSPFIGAGAGGKSTEKKPRKKSDAPPSAWLVFTGRVRELLRSNGYEKAALGKECQMFCGYLKEKNTDLASWSDADILASRADWSAPEVSKQAAAGKSWRKSKSGASSVASGADDDAASAASSSKSAPKKRTWSAAAKASAAAKRAAKKTASPSEDDFDDEPVGTSKTAAKKAVMETKKKLSEVSNAAAPAPAPAAAAASSSSAPSGFKKVKMGEQRYWINQETGHTYLRLEDESQGEWAGLFKKSGGPKGGPWIDSSIPEPAAEEDEEEEENAFAEEE